MSVSVGCDVGGLIKQAFQSDMADTLEAIKLVVRPCLILVELTLATNQALFPMVVAPLTEGSDDIAFK